MESVGDTYHKPKPGAYIPHMSSKQPENLRLFKVRHQPNPPKNTVRRLLEQITVVDGCWVWNGHLNSCGYGFTYRRVNGKKVWSSAQRISYQVFKGKTPHELEIDHLCRNRRCINPKHLELVTESENKRRTPIFINRTHCKWGHEFTPENTGSRKRDKARICLTCKKESSRKAWQNKKKH